MTFIEFRRRNGTRFLFDFVSQWEIDDKGNKPALWGNPEQCRNMDCAETYEQVRAKLLEPTQPVAEPTPAQALDSVRVFWQQHTQADALSMTMAELHADVELVIRAARGAAQAAPVGMEPTARIRYERNTPGRENEMPRVLSCNRMADGVYEVFTAAQVQAMLAGAPTPPLTHIGDKP